jgi:ABC-type transporter Mla subunit MlaD
MTQALKVGIFATIVLLLVGWFVLKIEDLNPFAPQGRVIDAVFESIAGLDDRSAVRIAGVRVGTVDGIELADRFADIYWKRAGRWLYPYL